MKKILTFLLVLTAIIICQIPIEIKTSEVVTATPEKHLWVFSKNMDSTQLANVGKMFKEANKIRVLLPDTLSAVVGDTLQVFFRGVFEAPDLSPYHITVSSAKGQQYNRYYEYAPVAGDTVTNNYQTIFRIYDHQYTLLGSDTTIIKVQKAWQPTVTNVLPLGDSFTEATYWATEFYRRLTGSGGTPAGDAFTGLVTIGNRGNGNNKRVGFGGMGWAFYATKTAATTLTNRFWFYGTHDKDVTDINSVYQDGNGNKWKLDSLYAGKVAFKGFISGITYHTIEPPASGTLTYVSGGTHNSNITYLDIERTCGSAGNPFWDYAGVGINFEKYCTRNGISDIDAMICPMTWNEVENNKPNASDYAYRLPYARIVLDSLHSQYPSAKVIIAAPQLPCAMSGFGSAYTIDTIYGYYYGKVRGVFGYNLAMKELCNETAYKSWVTYCDMNAEFDNEYSYTFATKKPNLRYTSYDLREDIASGGVHPAANGYYQIADSIYRTFVRIFCK